MLFILLFILNAVLVEAEVGMWIDGYEGRWRVHLDRRHRSRATKNSHLPRTTRMAMKKTPLTARAAMTTIPTWTKIIVFAASACMSGAGTRAIFQRRHT